MLAALPDEEPGQPVRIVYGLVRRQSLFRPRRDGGGGKQLAEGVWPAGYEEIVQPYLRRLTVRPGFPRREANHLDGCAVASQDLSQEPLGFGNVGVHRRVGIEAQESGSPLPRDGSKVLD